MYQLLSNRTMKESEEDTGRNGSYDAIVIASVPILPPVLPAWRDFFNGNTCRRSLFEHLPP
jgi:hypothetical protein